MRKSQEPDPFAPWRDAEEFEILEAAHLCAGVVPGLAFKPLKLRDRAEEEERARVVKWQERLKLAAADLGVATVSHPARRNFTRDIRGQPVETSPTPARVEYGKVQREALVGWLASIGQRPPFFFPEPEDKPLGTREERTLLQIIAVLAELAGIDMRGKTAMHKEAGELRPEFLARGFKITSETLAAKLREARGELPLPGPASGAPRKVTGKP